MNQQEKIKQFYQKKMKQQFIQLKIKLIRKNILINQLIQKNFQKKKIQLEK